MCELKKKHGPAICIGCPYYKDGKCIKDFNPNTANGVADFLKGFFK